MGLAESPTTVRIESLKEARASAEAEMAALRRVREQLIGRLKDVSVTIERSSNDQGALYGSVTQRDIADALVEAGYGVDVKAVRLAQPVRRIGTYPVAIQFERDLKAEISVVVKADRELDLGTAEEEEAPAETREAPPMPVVDAVTGEVSGEAGSRRGRKGRREKKS
jgi:large subunit ribosomal protein L9